MTSSPSSPQAILIVKVGELHIIFVYLHSMTQKRMEMRETLSQSEITMNSFLNQP